VAGVGCATEFKVVGCFDGVAIDAAVPLPDNESLVEVTMSADSACLTGTTRASAAPKAPNAPMFGTTAPIGDRRVGDRVTVTFQVLRLPERTAVLQTSGPAVMQRVDPGACDGHTCVDAHLTFNGTDLVPARKD